MSRIVVFGATGYTGTLTAERLADDPEAEQSLVLAGRNESKLESLARSLEEGRENGPKISVAVADISDPASVRALVSDPSDALISTVGPFTRWGRPAVDAAIEAGCTYLDSTGEPIFIRRLFEQDSARAQQTGARLLPAFGFDYVPGNLAGALLLADAAEAGRTPTSIRIGYFMPGGVDASSGTASTGAQIAFEPSYTYAGGQIETEHAGRRVGKFQLDGEKVSGLSVGGTEQFGLPMQSPSLEDVAVFVGAAGKLSRPLSVASHGMNIVLRIPGVKNGLQSLAARLVKGSQGGPDREARAAVTSVAIAQALDDAGSLLARVVVQGPSPYDLTADTLAWGATNSARIQATGTLAPTEAFGLDAFVDGMASIGLHRQE